MNHKNNRAMGLWILANISGGIDCNEIYKLQLLDLCETSQEKPQSKEEDDQYQICPLISFLSGFLSDLSPFTYIHHLSWILANINQPSKLLL